MQNAVAFANNDVITVASNSAPPGWLKEMLTIGFAIIHDKIVVIDPLSKDSVVITGSHNLGHKASFNNDENLAIIRGNRPLAEAYASHVLDVYDHFAWRVTQTNPKMKGDGKLKTNPDEWQAKYFNKDGSIRTGAAEVLARRAMTRLSCARFP